MSNQDRVCGQCGECRSKAHLQPTGGPGPDPDPPAGGADSVPKGPVTAGCTGGERYKTCTSGLYEFNAAEYLKTGSAFCPVGYAALGGGYGGVLQTALVQVSAPLTCTAKERAGWTVTVGRILPEATSDMVNQLSQVFRHAHPIKFTVFVVCAPAS